MSEPSLHFDSIDVFRQYVNQTKQSNVRTVFFRVTNNIIQVYSMFVRSVSTQEDIEYIVNVICASSSIPWWFVVRTDFNDSYDSSWAVGYYQPAHLRISDEAILPFVTSFTRELFPNAAFFFYTNIHAIEDDVWSHLFPLPMNGENVAPSMLSQPSIHEIVDIPKNLSFVARQNVRLSYYCRNRKCCFVTIPKSDDSAAVLVYLFNPEISECICRNCGKTAVLSSINNLTVERTVYSFMKPEIRQYLATLTTGNVEFKMMGDVSTCADLEIYDTLDESKNKISRRRSNDSVLSPPTFEKYNKGASKRTRPQAQALFN